ncbi:F0F1 ATP synthase subunit delta [Woodsholea maritima]|uniref:F0F1 ATP synthase subunit delta n=1 Tax=Woodsholea maritima TaxID=240237 RepID=UPI00036FD50B|nr:F0F1 ATP synthase subunit delta [Woodsholea maritima]
MSTGQHAITGEASKRYAKALFDLALEANALDSVERDMDAFGAAFDAEESLAKALASPVVSSEEKGRVISALAEKMGVSDIIKNYVRVVAQNGRAGLLQETITAFKARLATHRGAVTADVTSADALTATQLKELGAALKNALGRDVEIRTQVREDLIGGLIIQVGSRMFDSSLSTKLERMRNAMKEA